MRLAVFCPGAFLVMFDEASAALENYVIANTPVQMQSRKGRPADYTVDAFFGTF